jgi:hypothetical protein
MSSDKFELKIPPNPLSQRILRGHSPKTLNFHHYVEGHVVLKHGTRALFVRQNLADSLRQRTANYYL